MKDMNIKENLAFDRCPSFRHVSLFVILALLNFSAFSSDLKNEGSRSPASAFDEEILTVPLEQKVIIQSLFAEDDAGVMRGMRDTLNSWRETEDYARNWDLESTHLYKTPTTKEKTKFISKNLLRYADKRLAGEIKNAEEGSAFQRVGRVEKSLRPNVSVPVSKYISIKFKARVLEGKAVMDIRNPWIESSATVKANGRTMILTKKDFKQFGTSAGFEFNVNESQWVSFVDQEITNNIKARLSSRTTPNGDDADKKVEMTASFPFNL